MKKGELKHLCSMVVLEEGKHAFKDDCIKDIMAQNGAEEVETMKCKHGLTLYKFDTSEDHYYVVTDYFRKAHNVAYLELKEYIKNEN